MDKRYKRLVIALAAVATIYLVQYTQLDQGLIEDVWDGLVEALFPAPLDGPVGE